MGPRFATAAAALLGCAAGIAVPCEVLAASPAERARDEVAAGDRIVYLRRDGMAVRPGANDARTGTSSIAKHPVTIPGWHTSDEVWAETVACLERIYAPFAVSFTDEDPGDVPHIAAVFGGSPLMLDLARNVAGMSPFTSDCAIIESSIVYTFTDILPPDAATACRVMAQEIGHSYGLDHELRAGDPMSVQAFAGERAFGDEDVACGETTARPCGLPTTQCRATQNSYALLLERLGPAGEGTLAARTAESDELGCRTARGGNGVAVALALAAVLGHRRRRVAARQRR